MKPIGRQSRGVHPHMSSVLGGTVPSNWTIARKSPETRETHDLYFNLFTLARGQRLKLCQPLPFITPFMDIHIIPLIDAAVSPQPNIVPATDAAATSVSLPTNTRQSGHSQTALFVCLCQWCSKDFVSIPNYYRAGRVISYLRNVLKHTLTERNNVTEH